MSVSFISYPQHLYHGDWYIVVLNKICCIGEWMRLKSLMGGRKEAEGRRRRGRRGRRRTTIINNNKKKEEEEMFHHCISLCLAYLGYSKIAFPLGLQSHRRKTIQMCKVLCKCLTLTGKGMYTSYGSNLK